MERHAMKIYPENLAAAMLIYSDTYFPGSALALFICTVKKCTQTVQFQKNCTPLGEKFFRADLIGILRTRVNEVRSTESTMSHI